MELLGSENIIIYGNFLEVTSTLVYWVLCGYSDAHTHCCYGSSTLYFLHFNLNYLKCTMAQLVNVGGGTYVRMCFQRNAPFFTPEWGPLRLTPHETTLMW